MRETISFGKAGEESAVKFLENNGYRILERNFRNRFGEIDIIARDKDTLCFIEVRSRSSDFYGQPFETVIARKQRKIAKLAFSYLFKRKIAFDIKARFDVVSAVPDKNGVLQIEIIKNAFEVRY